MYVGRIDDNKGLSFLLSTFSKIICEQPNVHLVLAGDGNISECLKSAYPFWHKITFLGYIDKVVLEEIYSIADIGIICSLFEEFGYVAIEMMMHKLPIVTTDTGGLSEIFEDNYNCLKVPLTRNNNEAFIDTNILKQKINQILTNKVLAKKLGDNARKDFLKKYEYNVWENKMNFFIKTLQS